LKHNAAAMTDQQITSEPSNTKGAMPCISVLLAVAAFAAIGIRTLSSSNIWFHIASGRWIADHGLARTDPFSYTLDAARWINTSWLYDLLAYATWQVGHAPLLILVHVVCAVLAILMLAQVARRHEAGHAGIALAILLSGWLLSSRFFPTPALAALVFPACFLWCLTAGKRTAWLFATLIPAQLLWANFHTSYMLGPLLCLGFSYQVLRQPERSHGITFDRMFLLAVVLMVVSTINPQGLYLHAYAATTWLTSIENYTFEWISPYYAQFGSPLTKHLITGTYLIGACGLITYRSKLPAVVAGMAILVAILVIVSNRFLELFAVLSLPFIALSITTCGAFMAERMRWPQRRIEACLHLLTVVLAAFTLFVLMTNLFYVHVGSMSRFGMSIEKDVYPEGVTTLIRSDTFPDRTVHLSMDAGYLLWRIPTFRVFVDPRATAYGDEFFHTMALMLTGDEDARSTIEARWNPEAVIINCTWPSSGRAVRALIDSDQWALAYFDGVSAVLLRALSKHRELINDEINQARGITLIRDAASRYSEQVQRRFPPPPPARLVGAANVFMALGRHREASEIYSLLAKGAPRMIVARMSLGVCHVHLGTPTEALPHLRAVAQRYPKNAKVWLWLSRAYADAGERQAAKQAYLRAAELNPSAAMKFGNPSDRRRLSSDGQTGSANGYAPPTGRP